MSQTQYLGLDIGEARTGVATADDGVRIAIPVDTISMPDTDFRTAVVEYVTRYDISVIVIGYPRNQSGEPTKQSHFVEQKAAELTDIDATIVFQDESLTSHMAEERLKKHGQIIEKGLIDQEAATIILQDYLEQRR